MKTKNFIRFGNKTTKTRIREFLFVFSLILFGSCAVHYGQLSTNAVIVDKNFHIVGVGIGESHTIKILGVGGLKKNAMVFEAKKNYTRKPL
jgi:glycerol uptake facilitator-like aquaporin